MKLSVIVPAFNEAPTIAKVLQRILEVELLSGLSKEVVVVDDCSTDATAREVRSFAKEHPLLPLIYLKQEINRGKGAAIRTGIFHCSGDFILIQDADLEYNPAEYNVLLEPLLKGQAEVVYGSRFIGKRNKKSAFFGHTAGNKLLTRFSNRFTRFDLTDMETCYKVFKAEVLKNLSLRENRFGFEPEVTCKLSRGGTVRLKEVSVSYLGRSYRQGKKIGWKDGVRTIYCILKYGMLKAD